MPRARSPMFVKSWSPCASVPMVYRAKPLFPLKIMLFVEYTACTLFLGGTSVQLSETRVRQ